MEKIDYKKKLKHLYSPSARKPEIVDVPPMNFLMADGQGDPNTSQAFKEAVEALFGLSYTLKFMIKKGQAQVDYGVMPLEGLWWANDLSDFAEGRKENWKWTAMIMQPGHVTEKLVVEAREQLGRKKDISILPSVRFESFEEGKAVQVLHVGPFSEEGPTIERLHKFAVESGYRISGKHHEIYLSDLRRAAPEKWKTVVRQPITV